jgi:hypothetical protein
MECRAAAVWDLSESEVGVGAAGEGGGLPGFGVIVPLFIGAGGGERGSGAVPCELTMELDVADEEATELVVAAEEFLKPAVLRFEEFAFAPEVGEVEEFVGEFLCGCADHVAPPAASLRRTQSRSIRRMRPRDW